MQDLAIFLCPASRFRVRVYISGYFFVEGACMIWALLAALKILSKVCVADFLGYTLKTEALSAGTDSALLGSLLVGVLDFNLLGFHRLFNIRGEEFSCKEWFRNQPSSVVFATRTVRASEGWVAAGLLIHLRLPGRVLTT